MLKNVEAYVMVDSDGAYVVAESSIGCQEIAIGVLAEPVRLYRLYARVEVPEGLAAIDVKAGFEFKGEVR